MYNKQSVSELNLSSVSTFFDFILGVNCLFKTEIQFCILFNRHPLSLSEERKIKPKSCFSFQIWVPHWTSVFHTQQGHKLAFKYSKQYFNLQKLTLAQKHRACCENHSQNVLHWKKHLAGHILKSYSVCDQHHQFCFAAEVKRYLQGGKRDYSVEGIHRDAIIC